MKEVKKKILIQKKIKLLFIEKLYIHIKKESPNLIILSFKYKDFKNYA